MNKPDENAPFICYYKGVGFFRHNKLSSVEMNCFHLCRVDGDKTWDGYVYISQNIMTDSNMDWRDIAIEMVMDDLKND